MTEERREYLQDALGYVENRYIDEAAAEENLRNKKPSFVWEFLKIVAIFVVGFALIPILHLGGPIGGRAPGQAGLYEYFKPEEMETDALPGEEKYDGPEVLAEDVFARDTAIFRGTVTDMHTYRTVANPKSYFTILTVRVSEVIRGTGKRNSFCQIYMPLVSGYPEEVEEGNLDLLEIGSEGIFMPYKARMDETVVLGGEEVPYRDFADYCFKDGEYSLFLEKDGEVLYSDIFGITTERGPVTLDDVESYIRYMTGRE